MGVDADGLAGGQALDAELVQSQCIWGQESGRVLQPSQTRGKRESTCRPSRSPVCAQEMGTERWAGSP